ncbi:ABC transporter permease [Paenibacillaceae bacterium WGS1546]|uniref:ABC transporter permease n=1 Tax=Cohnella sp. WGS1546 TaxID=3366810 RepID=UPI00372CFDEB
MADISTTNNVPVRPANKGFATRLLKQWDIQLMVWPGIILIFVFAYLPMYGVLTGFMDYKLHTGANIFANEWVGFKHIRMFIDSPDFNRVIRNTLVISGLKLLFGFPAPVLLALMLNEVRNMMFKRTVQTVTYLPHFLSWVVVAGMVTSLLSVDNGSVNILLMKLGIISQPLNFLSMSEYFWAILVSSNVWKDIGFSSIVYLAAIASIDQHQYEAAQIDGASRFQQIRYITFPSIIPVVTLFLILAIGQLLNAGFEDILLLANNPALRNVSDVVDVYVYRIGLQNYRYSYATAIGLFKAIISVGLLVMANYFARRSGNSLW